MKVARGRVVNGTVVTETPLPEGARVAIVLDDDRPAFDLEPEDEAAIETAVKDLDAGAGKPVADLKLSSRGIAAEDPLAWEGEGWACSVEPPTE